MTTSTQVEHAQIEALYLAACFDDNTSVVGAKRIAAEFRRLDAENKALHAQVAALTAATAQPAAPQGVAYAGLPDASTKGEWFVRKLEKDGELKDCFVAAPDCTGCAYDAEILGDDEYRGDMVRKLADCELIVNAVKHYRASNGQAPAASPWKDHQTREIVNQLRDCAKEYHATQQLRERLLDVLGPMIDWVRAVQAPTTAQAAPAAGAVAGPSVRKVFLVATGEEHEGEATYTRYDDDPPPLCDSECLYTAAPTPAAQADSQPTPVQDYPPLPECQGKIFDDGYWIQNKLGPKHCVMGGAKVWLESQVHKAIDADRAARAPTDSVLEDAARLAQIEEAIRDYHHALDMRKHGGLAESVAFNSICQTKIGRAHV